MLRAEIEEVKNIVRVIAKEEIDKAITELKKTIKKSDPVPVSDKTDKKIDRKEGK